MSFLGGKRTKANAFRCSLQVQFLASPVLIHVMQFAVDKSPKSLFVTRSLHLSLTYSRYCDIWRRDRRFSHKIQIWRLRVIIFANFNEIFPVGQSQNKDEKQTEKA